MSIKRELDELAKYCKGFGINVGCGNQPIGGSIGVDYNAEAVEAVIEVVGHKLPFTDTVLDYVVACNAFEHFAISPILTLREWARCLRIGGTAAVVVPDAEYGMWAMTGDRGQPGQLCKPERAMEHLHAFTETTLELLFEFSGFKVIRCEKIYREPERPETTLICVGMKSGAYVK